MFIGKIVGNPEIEIENNAKVVRFHVNIEEVRKDKHGDKKKMYTMLGFEAWDTGAEAIRSNCCDGTMIGIEANARYDEESEEVYFRIKNFKVL